MSVPSTMVKGLKAGSSSLTFVATGGSEEALGGGHQGLRKNSRGSSFIVSGIPGGIMGLLLHISCGKAQQP